MVRTRTSEVSILDISEGSVGHGHGQVPRGSAPPPPPHPPVNLEQLLAMWNDLANNPDIKKGILHTQIFWQLTHQSLPMRMTL
jgi:hypothetical protein